MKYLKLNFEAFKFPSNQTPDVNNLIEYELLHYVSTNQTDSILSFLLNHEKSIFQLLLIQSIPQYIQSKRLTHSISDIAISFVDFLIDSVDNFPFCFIIASAKYEKKGFELIYTNKQYN